MTDFTPDTGPQIDASLWGFAKPILTAVVTRGLLWLAAALAAHGIVIPNPTQQEALTVVGVIVAGAMWAWGPIKAYLDHRIKVQLAPPQNLKV